MSAETKQKLTKGCVGPTTRLQQTTSLRAVRRCIWCLHCEEDARRLARR